MIHAEQVQDPVQHQDADLVELRMPELAGLPGGAAGGDGQLAQPSCSLLGGKRQYVGRVIVAEEFAIQAAQLAIVGDQAVKLAAGRNRITQAAGEGLERWTAQSGGSAAK